MREKNLFEQYHDFVDATRKPGGRNFPALYPCVGLCAEAGEVIEIIQKRLRKGESALTEEDKVKIADELGDVLWYVTALCNDLEFYLEDIIVDNMTKLKDRIKKDG